MHFLLVINDTIAPKESQYQLATWCKRRSIDLDKLCTEYKSPNIFDDEPVLNAEFDLELVNIIRVLGSLVDVGQAAEMLGNSTPSKKEDSNKKTGTRAFHIEWLMEAIPKLMDIEGKIYIYYAENAMTEKEINEVVNAKKSKRDFFYRIIEFHTQDGDRHQMATNNWYGGGTYVIKPTKDIDPSQPKLVHIPNLLGSGQACPIRCMNQEQYTRSAIEHCNTNLEDLAPYIPKISWANKALQVTQYCIQRLTETGEKIRKNDRSPLKMGALTGLTTESRMAAAIAKKGTIAGLGAEGYDGFYNMLFEQNVRLEDHHLKPQVIASDVYNDAVKIIRDTEVVPQIGLLSDMELAGTPAEIVSDFFKLNSNGCVVGWHDLLPEQRQIPANINEFMIATGLAVDKGHRELEPNYEHHALTSKVRGLG